MNRYGRRLWEIDRDNREALRTCPGFQNRKDHVQCLLDGLMLHNWIVVDKVDNQGLFGDLHHEAGARLWLQLRSSHSGSSLEARFLQYSD